jgi:hypothetical protein
VVVRAYDHAVQEGSRELGETHLFEALLDDEMGAVFFEAVVGAEVRADVVAEIELARRTGGLTTAETEALAGLGVDVGALVGRIEERLGAGALAGQQAGQRNRWQRLPLSGTVVQTLDEGERQAALVGSRSLGIEHLALGVVMTPSLLAESLARRGITVDTVKSAAGDQRQRGARG